MGKGPFDLGVNIKLIKDTYFGGFQLQICKENKKAVRKNKKTQEGVEVIQGQYRK